MATLGLAFLLDNLVQVMFGAVHRMFDGEQFLSGGNRLNQFAITTQSQGFLQILVAIREHFLLLLGQRSARPGERVDARGEEEGA